MSEVEVLGAGLRLALGVGRSPAPVGYIPAVQRNGAGDPVDLYVNKKKFAEGEVVVVEQNFAVRITNLVSAQDRISSARNGR